MAVDEALVHLDRAREEYPAFPSAPNLAAIAGYFFSGRGTLYRASKSGTEGDPRHSSADRGRECLDQIEEALVRFVADVNEIFACFQERLE